MKNISYKLLLLFFLFSVLTCKLHASNSDRIFIIPTPRQTEIGKGYFSLKQKVSISVSNNKSLYGAADYLKAKLENGAGLKCSIKEKGKADIVFKIMKLKDETPGAYILAVTNKQITITSNNYQGLISGISSLRQLLPPEIESEFCKNDTIKWKVPSLKITDAPRFQYRGMMLDVARHYYDKEEVMIFLDRMALYKLNKFHWHLTDNEAWRIEIKQYPELAHKSGWRKYNHLDNACAAKAANDKNPEFELPEKYLKQMDGQVNYGGYYTQEDIKEVVAYATKLGIDVIPEIDMPGHFNAASAIFPGIICPGANIASSPVCVGNDSAITFCKNIFDEVFKLFPYQYVHLGADEVGKDNWQNCPLCQKRIKEEGLKDEKELQSWFVHNMESYFENNGKKLIGWDEITEGKLSQASTIMWWTGSRETLDKSLANGNKVILTPNQWVYFDHGQTNNSIKRVYDYEPLLQNIDMSLILGVQANIWTEYIPSLLRVDYMSMPKMLCLSEIAWVNSDQKNWELFSKKITEQIPRLDALNINYRIPHLESDLFLSERKIVYLNVPPEEWLCDTISIASGKKLIDIQKPFPGIVIRYTTDGTIPTVKSVQYTTPFWVEVPGEYMFATFRPNGTRGEFRKIVFIK